MKEIQPLSLPPQEPPISWKEPRNSWEPEYAEFLEGDEGLIYLYEKTGRIEQ